MNLPLYAGYAGTCERLSCTPLLLTWLIVGSVPDGVAEAPSLVWDRRLELPFALEVAA